MMKLLGLILVLCSMLFLVGCTVSSQYIVTEEYTNPRTGGIEQIDIPVSQYQYEQIDVGDSYSIRVHPVVFGLTVPVVDGNGMGIAMLDVLPIIFISVGLVIAMWKIPHWQKRRDFIGAIVMVVIVLGVGALMVLTRYPEFTADGIIVDKTFQIVSSGL
jgi:hypothetical protein